MPPLLPIFIWELALYGMWIQIFQSMVHESNLIVNKSNREMIANKGIWLWFGDLAPVCFVIGPLFVAKKWSFPDGGFLNPPSSRLAEYFLLYRVQCSPLVCAKTLFWSRPLWFFYAKDVGGGGRVGDFFDGRGIDNGGQVVVAEGFVGGLRVCGKVVMT
ncbi:hypothetical protein RJT34_32449 [Clitoria ternatea]|uniref:Uncharacterized protein n=1 Tax=Clitoria ternatea TaxID=43366 RepID=A0AAN9EWF8_CLITE